MGRLTCGMCCLLAACVDPKKPAAPHRTPDPSLAATIERTHGAFRPSAGAAFESSRLRVAADGRVHARSGTDTLTLELTHLCRDGRCTATPPAAPPRIEPQTGALIIDRGALLEERWASEARASEQTLLLAEAPKGSGDLTVRLRLEGSEWTRLDERGHHFGPFSYGEAFLYGSEKIPLELRRWDRGLDIVVPAALAHGPLVIDPAFGVDVLIGLSGIGPSTYPQVQPAIASNGYDYFAVWSDYRESTTDAPSPASIFGTRLDRQGVVLDLAGTRVSSAGAGGSASHDVSPRVGWDSQNWLVVWERRFLDGGSDVVATRMSDAGSAVDPLPTLLSSTAGSEVSPDIACEGGTCFVAWGLLGADAGIFGKGYYGGVFDLTPTRVAAPQYAVSGFSVVRSVSAAFSTEWVVAWNEADGGALLSDGGPAGDLHLVRVGGMGPADPPFGVRLNVCTAPGSIATASDSQGWVAVVYPHCSGGLQAAKVSSNLLTRDAGAIISYAGTQPAIGFLRDPRADAGNGFVVAWSEPSGTPGAPTVKYSRLFTAGFNTGPTVDLNTALAQPGDRIEPAVGAANSTIPADFMLVFRRGGAEGLNVAATTGALQELLFSKATNTQQTPVAASSGSDYMLAWSEFRLPEAPRIFISPVLDGGLLSGSPGGVLLGSASTLAPDEKHPAIAFAKQKAQYLVAWDEADPASHAVKGRRVGVDGVPSDTSALPISGQLGAYGWPAVASDGHDFRVMWIANPSGLTDGDELYFADVLFTTGVGPAQNLQLPNDQASPSLVFNGSQYIAAWQTRFNDGGSSVNIGVAAATTTTFTDVTDPAYKRDARSPMLATDGTSTLLVVWHQAGKVYAQLLDSKGQALAGIAPIRIADADPSMPPAVAFDGTEYVVAYRSNSSLPLGSARMPNDGGGLDWSAGTTAEGFQRPALAGGGDSALLSYEKLLTTRTPASRQYGARRAYYRMFTAAKGGAACNSGLDCSSGQCVRGICCAATCTVGICAPGSGACVSVDGGLPNGAACGAANDCDSGFCTSGTCCNTACDGGACVGCASGTCSALALGTSCDDDVYCNGHETCGPGGQCDAGAPVVCENPKLTCDERVMACMPLGPTVTSKPELTVFCGAKYTYAPQSSGPGDVFTLSLAPEGASFDGGVITWVNTPEQVPEQNQFQLDVNDATGATSQQWTVTVLPCQLDFKPDCGCAGGGGGAGLLLALALLKRRQSSRCL